MLKSLISLSSWDIQSSLSLCPYELIGAIPKLGGGENAFLSVLSRAQRALEAPLCLFSFRLYCSHSEKKITQILTPSLYTVLFVLLKRLGFKLVRRDSKLGAEVC